ncbi:MAG: hypothetical protein LC804_26950 [Acidobacteria bacterium]|nr:hypothetical protein [Acidobacteriota bacterium]
MVAYGMGTVTATQVVPDGDPGQILQRSGGSGRERLSTAFGESAQFVKTVAPFSSAHYKFRTSAQAWAARQRVNALSSQR